MVNPKRAWWTPCVRNYVRYFLIGFQLTLLCLLVYDKAFCGSALPDHRTQTLQTVIQSPQNQLLIIPDVPSYPKRLFYNRVPKCGSHTFLDVITQMSQYNNFTFTRSPEYMQFYLEDYGQMKFVDLLRQIDTPMLYERHLHFVDFPHYGLSQPVYINLVRNPLQRLVSWYYFHRFQPGHVRQMGEVKRNRTFDECVRGNYSECVNMQGDNPEEGYFKVIPFFCGQQEFCRQDNKRSLQTAMRNVDRNYLVVGVTEQFSDYVGALEHLLPSYFKGANQFYRNSETELRAKHRTMRKIAPSDDVVRRMQKLLENEFIFYQFVRQKFNKLIYSLRQREIIRTGKLLKNKYRAKS